jgi:hypothetical protein
MTPGSECALKVDSRCRAPCWAKACPGLDVFCPRGTSRAIDLRTIVTHWRQSARWCSGCDARGAQDRHRFHGLKPEWDAGCSKSSTGEQGWRNRSQPAPEGTHRHHMAA